ncbi:MAG: hypothetical protein QN168_04245 [Armatimonadota bacterium]|nr:hypothetical protein [Armatimonadota bacterium]
MESLRARVAAHLSEWPAILDRLVRRPSVAAHGRRLEETAAVVGRLFGTSGRESSACRH